MKTLIFTFLVLFAGTSLWAQSAKVLSGAERTEIISQHNQWRSKVGVPDLKWSDKLAEEARKWALQQAKQSCQMQHSSGPYGENIYWATFRSNPADVVDSWGSEIENYTYRTNTCATNEVCGHYTQIVWRNTTEVGCAVAQCRNGNYIWMCMYNPPGNWSGQKPY